MTGLRAQLAMELWVLRPYARQFVLLVAAAAVFGVWLDTIVPLAVMMALLTSTYTFAISETARLETLFATLPVGRTAVVAARYLVTIGTLLAMGLTAIGIEAVIAAVRGEAWDGAAAFAVLALAFAASATVIAFQFPCAFALGYTRSRIVNIVTIGAVSAGTVLLVSTGAVAGPLPAAMIPLLIAGGVAVGLAVLAASAAVSARIYARKDL